MRQRKIFFRADAGQEIGYGHFIRSLALADMLREEFDCTFYTSSPSTYQIEEMEKVCNHISLNERTKFEDFINLLEGDEIVVLDNYFYTTDYQKQIKEKGCKLVCIDDMHKQHYVADIVINHGCQHKELFSIEPYTQLCLGLDYALLRKPFLQAACNHTCHRDPLNKIERVAICYGGSDPLHLTEKTLEHFVQDVAIQNIDVIVGSHFSNHSLFPDERVRFYQSISAEEVATIFKRCQLAVVSASSVCIEALACGAIVAAGWYVDNQKEFYDYLKDNQWIIPLGDLSHIPFLDIQNTKCSKLTFSPIKENYLKLFKYE